jgi:2-keto-4-pentenoate hydratase
MTINALAASEFLNCLWTEGGHIDEIPAPLRPDNASDAYGIQALLEKRSGAPLFGWKLAATSKAGQEHINVDRPLIGRILAERALPDGSIYSGLDDNVMQVAELEFAFRFGADIEPRERTWTATDALETVASLHPAIELPDSRYRRYETVGAAQLIADNACAHYFVLGPAAPSVWRTTDLAEHQPWGVLNGNRFRQGLGRNVLGDPRAALAWFLNEAARYSMVIRAGEIVTTGTCMVPMPISHGTLVSGDFGDLGAVSVRVA